MQSHLRARRRCWPPAWRKLVALRRTAAGRAQGRASCCSTSRPTPATPAPPPTSACSSRLHNTLQALAAAGYTVEVPATVDALRDADHRAATPRASARTPTSHARIPADDHVRRERWLREIEAQWGPAPGRQQSDGGSIFVLGAQFGNVLRRRPARLRLRGRPDAAAVREGLRADPRLLRLLPLAARGFRRPRRAAFRHPRRARVHARQADRHVGRLLAGPADRRPAEPLPLRRQQPVRGHASPSGARRRR